MFRSPTVVDTSGDNFRMRVGGVSYDKCVDAGSGITDWARRNYVGSIPSYVNRDLGELGEVGG